MKLIIAGGRLYNFTEEDIKALDLIHDTFTITEVVSGGANGADKCGEEWAKQNNIPVKVFPAEWGKYSRSAGVIRNREMAEYLAPTDAVILFPGGIGTDDMAMQARKKRLKIFDHRD